MNPLIQHTKTTTLLLVTFALVCLTLSPSAQAQPGCFPQFTTAAGCDAVDSVTTGTANSGLGWRALFSNSTGNFNTGVGGGALSLNNADSNTAVGAAAMLLNTTGTQNTAVGTDAMVYNDSGSDNTATGFNALSGNLTGGANTANGSNALSINTTGSQNTAVGNLALTGSNGDNNTAVGASAGSGVTTASNVTCIGWNVAGADVSNTTWIGNVFGVTTQSGTTAPVIVSDTGQLGTVASSERFKKDIATMDKASEAIMSLRPVTFHYKTDTKGTPQFGLIAEEVAKVNPALVLPDKEGKPYTVRYDAVNAMLLNEFLKEHRKNEEQEATIARQQKQIEALTAGLQKVSAQLELSKSAPQTVLNNQ
jgi:hypothetical protein